MNNMQYSGLNYISIVFQTQKTSVLKNNKLAIAIILSYFFNLHFLIFVWLSPFFMWQYPVIMWRYPIFVWHSPFFELDIQNFVGFFFVCFYVVIPFFCVLVPIFCVALPQTLLKINILL